MRSKREKGFLDCNDAQTERHESALDKPKTVNRLKNDIVRFLYS